jgi:hypothetical protein
MADQATFYAQQAENCGKAAAEANLENERNKFLHARAVWQSLPDERSRTQAETVKRDAERRLSTAECGPAIR